MNEGPVTGDDLKERILRNYKGKDTSEETRQWLNALDSNSLNADDALTITPADANDFTPVAVFMDSLFDHLSRYASEFSANPSYQQIRVYCERPGGNFEFTDYSRFPTALKYIQGHVTMNDWALVVQAYEKKILVFVIPSELLIGFRPGDPSRKEYMLIVESGKTGNNVRTLLDRPISSLHLSHLARRIFGQLLRVVRGEASDAEEFAIAKTVSEYDLETDRSYDADESKWLLSEADFEEFRKRSTATPQGSQKAPPTPAAAFAGPAAKALPPSLTSNNQAVAKFCMSMVGDIDNLTSNLEQIGMAAMKQDGMRDVNQAMKRSQALKRLRDHVIEFAGEWDQILNEGK